MPKKNMLLFFNFSFLILLFGCSNEEIKENDNIHFDVSEWKMKQYIPQSTIKTIKFIPLETTENNLIGKINKIIVFKEKFYILDLKYRKDIIVFDNTGNYLQSIGKYGRGAGEYVRLTDFNIDEQRNMIIVLDSQLKKLMYYDLLNGDFIKEYKLDFWASNFSILDIGHIAFFSKDQNSKSKNSIAVLNLNENKHKWYLKKDEYDTSLSYDFSLFKSKNIYFASYLDDKVYKVSNVGTSLFATFNFGKNKVPSEKLKKIKIGNGRELIKLMAKGNWSCGIQNFIENDEFITFNLKLKGHQVFVIYSKRNGNCLYGNQYEKPLNKLRLIQNLTVTENNFISVCDIVSFKKMEKSIRENGSKELISEYLKISNKLTNQSNPVIISLEYNQF